MPASSFPAPQQHPISHLKIQIIIIPANALFQKEHQKKMPSASSLLSRRAHRILHNHPADKPKTIKIKTAKNSAYPIALKYLFFLKMPLTKLKAKEVQNKTIKLSATKRIPIIKNHNPASIKEQAKPTI